jgi:ribonuclease HI
MAIYSAVKWFSEHHIAGVIVTDSEYSMMAIGEYVIEWQRKGEVATHPNGRMILDIRRLMIDTGCNLCHIRSHKQGTDVHSRGNNYVDEMVRAITGG